MTGITIILMVLGGLCLLLISKKTRPAAWGAVILGVLLLALLALPVVFWTRSQQQSEYARHAQHRAQMEADLDKARVRFGDIPTVDIEKLLNSRIQFSDDPSPSAHPPLPVISTHDAVEEHIEQSTDVAATVDSGENDGSTGRTTESVDSSTNKKPLPTWVERLPKRTGGDYHVVFTTELFSNAEDAHLQADQWMMVITHRLMQAWAGHGAWDGRSLLTPPSPHSNHEYLNAMHFLKDQLGFSQSEISRQVIKDEYVEAFDIGEISNSITEPMKRVHVLLTYDDDFRQRLTQAYQQAQADRRIVNNVEAVAGTGAGVLAILSLIWGILKFDTATKGYYTKWLLGGGLAATIVAVFFFIVAVS